MTGAGNPYESIVPFLKAIPLAMFIIVAVVVAMIWLRRKAKEKRGELGGMTTVNATVIYKRRDVRRDLNSAPDDAAHGPRAEKGGGQPAGAACARKSL